jgi:hypothetical protein
MSNEQTGYHSGKLVSELDREAAERYTIEFTPIGIGSLSPLDAQPVPAAIKRAYLAGIAHARQPLPEMGEWNEIAENCAKAYARELGGFPRGTSLIAVNGHTRGWDDCADILVKPLQKRLNEYLDTHDVRKNGFLKVTESYESQLQATTRLLELAVGALENAETAIDHALELDYFNPGGSTEMLSKEALKNTRRALAEIRKEKP